MRSLALLSFLALGCGGNATESGDDSEPSASGGSAGTGGNADSAEVDPLLDENFDAALEEALRESCRLQIECFGSTQWGAEDECTEFFVDMVHTNYDVQSRECRGVMLDTYACFNETGSCNAGDDTCSVQELSGCLLQVNDGN